MKAYVFPGQGAQFEGMGHDLYEQSDLAKALFKQADELLGFSLSAVMFEGSSDDLKQTRVTQPAIFLHSIISVRMAKDAFQPDLTAGHSLGEFSALVAAGALSFEDGLLLVAERAQAMQEACEANPGIMAAILGMEDEAVEAVCQQLEETVVAANYNSPGQLVISGSLKGVQKAMVALQEQGAKRVVPLAVGGAFHSPLMRPAKERLEKAIANTTFKAPFCPIYQNVSAKAEQDPDIIQKNLIAQLTAPVKWTQTVWAMLDDGATEFIEVGGTGKVLQGLIKKVDRKIPTRNLSL